MSKKLRCDCGRWVARLSDDGHIYVWCRDCKKEVDLTIMQSDFKEPHKRDGPKAVSEVE